MSSDTRGPPLKYTKIRILFLHVFDKSKLDFSLSLLSLTVIDFRFRRSKRVAKHVADLHQVTLLRSVVLASECRTTLHTGSRREEDSFCPGVTGQSWTLFVTSTRRR